MIRLSHSRSSSTDALERSPSPKIRGDSGDAIIDLDERSVSIGTDRCSVTFIRNEPNAVRLFGTCDQEPDTHGSNGKADGSPVLPPPSSETIILKKTNNDTVCLQKSRNGDFTDPAAKLSYCGQDA